MKYNEKAFIDIITGAIGVLCLLIIILMLRTVINAKISLNVEAPIKNGKYPMFMICKNDSLEFVCRNTYLPSSSAQKELLEMCNSLKLAGISDADEAKRWVILKKFFSSEWFDSQTFYVYAFIKPDGIATYNALNQILRSNRIDVGYTPIAENWNIREALKVD